MPDVFHRASRRFPVLAVTACALLLAGCCDRSCKPAASSPLHATNMAVTSLASSPTRAVAASNYTPKTGDVLRVTVYGEQDLSGDYTVGPDGTIALPLAGAVNVSGLALGDVGGVVAAAYRGDYLKDPKVSVELRNQPQEVTP